MMDCFYTLYNVFIFSNCQGTQLDLRKLSMEHSPTSLSVKEALDQLHIAIECVGGEKKDVYNLVMDIIGTVSLSLATIH